MNVHLALASADVPFESSLGPNSPVNSVTLLRIPKPPQIRPHLRHQLTGTHHVHFLLQAVVRCETRVVRVCLRPLKPTGAEVDNDIIAN